MSLINFGCYELLDAVSPLLRVLVLYIEQKIVPVMFFFVSVTYMIDVNIIIAIYDFFHSESCFMQLCITTSTSAGLEQILPWIFYHKVIGVSTFFLFVEGKAATPNVSKVLESIPVSVNPLFSTSL